MDWIKRKLLAGLVGLISTNTSEFWTGTANMIAQFVLRGLAHLLGGTSPELAALCQKLADWLAAMFAYAAGRVASKVAKG